MNNMPYIVNFLDVTSSEDIENILRNYFELEALAMSGSLSAIDLYLEVKIALMSLGEVRAKEIMCAIQLENDIEIDRAVDSIHKLIEGTF